MYHLVNFGTDFWGFCEKAYSRYMSTPKGDGFRAPAEWEPHSACLIGWPWRKTIWQDLMKAQRAFLEVIRAICKAEKVIVIAHPGKSLITELAN